MHTRTRVPVNVRSPFASNVPLLEAGDLPGDDDWAFLESVRRDPLGDDDFDMSVHPDLD